MSTVSVTPSKRKIIDLKDDTFKTLSIMAIHHIVLDHDDADDVLQNAFVKAWTNLDSFQGKSSLSTWLYRIAINEALDFLRRKKQMVNVSTDCKQPKCSRAPCCHHPQAAF